MGYLTIDAINGYGNIVQTGMARNNKAEISIFGLKEVTQKPVEPKKEEYFKDKNNYDIFNFYNNGMIKSHEECRFEDGIYCKTRYEFDKTGKMVKQIDYDENDPTKAVSEANYLYKDGKLTLVKNRDYIDGTTEEFLPGPLYDELESGNPSENERLKNLRKK